MVVESDNKNLDTQLSGTLRDFLTCFEYAKYRDIRE